MTATFLKIYLFVPVAVPLYSPLCECVLSFIVVAMNGFSNSRPPQSAEKPYFRWSFRVPPRPGQTRGPRACFCCAVSRIFAVTVQCQPWHRKCIQRSRAGDFFTCVWLVAKNSGPRLSGFWFWLNGAALFFRCGLSGSLEVSNFRLRFLTLVDVSGENRAWERIRFSAKGRSSLATLN